MLLHYDSVLHTMEYYSALKRKEILTAPATQIHPEDIIAGEIRQPPHATHMRSPERSNSETGSRIVGTRIRGGGRGECRVRVYWVWTFSFAR